MNREASAVWEEAPGYESTAVAPVVLEGYKQTEVGVIPEDWDLATIIQLSSLIMDYRGRTPKKLGMDWGEGEIPALSAGNVKKGYIDFKAECYYGSEQLYKKWMTRGGTEKGDILFTTEAPLGNVALVPDSKKYILSQRTVLIRIIAEKAVSQFVYQYLFSDLFQKLLLNYSSGSTAKGIQRRKLEKLYIPLPPENEQQAIASTLSDVDALLEELDRLIAKKRNIKQATMQQLLTGQTRLPGFEGEWEQRSLLEVAENQKALFDDGDWVEAEHITDQGIRLVQTGNIGIGSFVEKAARKYIYEKSFEKLKCKELEVGDILICRLADPAGRACIFPDIGEHRAITSVDVTIFRPRPEFSDRNFLVQLFSTNEWFKSILDNVGGTTHKRISRGALGKLKVPFPQVEEQQAIASTLCSMDREIEVMEKRRAKVNSLKKAIMQELLTGRIRLPGKVLEEDADD